MEIITEGYPKDNQVFVDEVQITYLQNPDNCSGENDYQELTIITKDGGGGKYINFKTNEHGWSIGELKDLEEIFNDFQKRMS